MGRRSYAVTEADLKHVAWCGLWLRVPSTFCPCQVTGDSRRGRLAMAADGRRRLNIQWTTVTRRRVNAERIVQSQLWRGLSRRQIRRCRDHTERIVNDNLATMLCVSDPEAVESRCVGYSPTSRRLIEVHHMHAGAHERQLVRRATLGALDDQTTERPQRWSIFDLSFVSGEGMRYVSSKLNLGDISVQLVGPSRRGRGKSALRVRQIYPADLALSRQTVEAWMDQMLVEGRELYGRTHARGVPLAQRGTPIGKAVVADARMRRGMALLRWRTPRDRRHCLVHDEAHNRLFAIEVADHPDELEVQLSQVLGGLNWVNADQV